MSTPICISTPRNDEINPVTAVSGRHVARTPVCARYRRVPQAHPVRRSVVHRHHIPRHVRHRPIPQRPARSAPARAPYVVSRRFWIAVTVLFLADGVLVANLMYCRTYFTAIPLDSYLLAGNLSDFTASVVDSMRWLDILIPLTTVAAWIIGRRMPRRFPTVYTALPCRPRNCSAPLSNSSLVPRRIPCPLFAPAGVMLLHHMHHSDIYRRRLGNVRYPERQFTRARRSWTRAHRLMDGAKKKNTVPPRAHRLHRRPRQPGDYTSVNRSKAGLSTARSTEWRLHPCSTLSSPTPHPLSMRPTC